MRLRIVTEQFPEGEIVPGAILTYVGDRHLRVARAKPRKKFGLGQTKWARPKLIFSHGFAREQKVKPLSEEGAKDGRIAGVSSGSLFAFRAGSVCARRLAG